MYEVIVDFTDLHDKRYAYFVGDTFPHEGMTVSEERLKELSTDRNRRGIPLIKKVDTPKTNENTPYFDSTPIAEENNNEPNSLAKSNTSAKQKDTVEPKKKTAQKPKQTTKRTKKNAD